MAIREVRPGGGEIADRLGGVRHVSALGLAVVQVVDGGEPAQELTGWLEEGPCLDPVAHQRRPGSKTGDDLVAGPGGPLVPVVERVGSMEVEDHLIVGDGGEIPDLSAHHGTCCGHG